jgi:hypothetical protein
MAQKKAFVRYAANKAVPGSLIVRTKAPKVGTWKEVPYDVCCEATAPCVPPLYTPIELCYKPGEPCNDVTPPPCSDPCNDCTTEDVTTYYIYQTTIDNIPVVKLLNSQDPGDLADDGWYKNYSVNEPNPLICHLVIVSNGIMTYIGVGA